MKIRSKALYAYLSEANALGGTKEEIARLKLQYRTLYKRNWKRQSGPRKELRIEVTLRQFQDIKARAHELELRHTTYARQVILAAVGQQQLIPRKERLLSVLQLVSGCAIGCSRGTLAPWELAERLSAAERCLLDYLRTDSG